MHGWHGYTWLIAKKAGCSKGYVRFVKRDCTEEEIAKIKAKMPSLKERIITTFDHQNVRREHLADYWGCSQSHVGRVLNEHFKRQEPKPKPGLLFTAEEEEEIPTPEEPFTDAST